MSVWGDDVGRTGRGEDHFAAVAAAAAEQVGAPPSPLDHPPPHQPTPRRASAQASKLRLGGLSSATSFFDTAVVVHVSASPLVITFIGEPTANVGLMLRAAPLIAAAVEPLRSGVAQLSDA